MGSAVLLNNVVSEMFIFGLFFYCRGQICVFRLNEWETIWMLQNYTSEHLVNVNQDSCKSVEKPISE